MRGEKSHKILAKEMYGGTAILDGYEIYDCFQYPGVMEKENRKVFGEVYFVREQTLEMIDFYENEGVLFRRKKVMLSGKLKGDVYVYYDWNAFMSLPEKSLLRRLRTSEWNCLDVLRSN